MSVHSDYHSGDGLLFHRVPQAESNLTIHSLITLDTNADSLRQPQQGIHWLEIATRYTHAYLLIHESVRYVGHDDVPVQRAYRVRLRLVVKCQHDYGIFQWR